MRRALPAALAIVTLTVGLDAQEISPWLFGQNHWIDKGDEGNRPGYIHMLWPKIGESGITLVRIGGNGYNNRNHALFRSEDKLDSIIHSIRNIGAEPLLQIPAGKGETRDFTVRQAVELVKKYKYSDGEGVRFYCIGNEPLLHDRDGVQKVHDYVKALAPAMKAAHPTIKIFIFDECSLFEDPHGRIVGGDLDLTGKDNNGHWMIDGISFHRYPNTRRDFDRENVVFSGPRDIRRQAEQLKGMMAYANKKHGRTGNAQLLWGLTEFNVTTSNPDRDIAGIGNASFLGGQFIAEVYGLGMEFGAFTMAPWCISETDRMETDFGYLGLPPDFHPRSSYYHTQMMALNMKGAFLHTTSSNAQVATIGSQSDRAICVMILNRDEIHNFDFDLVLNRNGESDKALIVHADVGLDASIAGSIPNQTTILYVLSRSGEVRKQYVYGLTHNLKHQPPEVRE
jgi:hypothetical protein